MKKLSTLASLLFLAMSMSFVSCSSENADEEVVVSQAVQKVSKNQVVNLLKSASIDISMSREIHNEVCNTMATGRDEYARIGNVLNGNTRAGQNSVFVSQIKRVLAQEQLTRSTDAEALLEALSQSDIVIYWPYSEDWDGEELPTLVAAPDDEDAEEAIGYKVIGNGGNEYEEVLVNEEYAMQHPVWVINAKEEYPNVVYLTTSECEEDDTFASAVTRAATNPLHVWKMTKMKVTHHYDGLFKGGSEFDIQVVYPKLPGLADIAAKFRVNFSRKYIRKGKWKTLNLLLNTNWTENQINNALIITESDDGEPITITTTVSSKADDNTQVSGSIGVTIKDNDDIICQQPISRDYALLHDTYSFDGGRVTVVAPIVEE